jgi:8-oxo-dGTP diphosphatase
MEKEYEKVLVVVGVVVKQDGKYLLVQENRPEEINVHKRWCIPAGKVDLGDTIEGTAIKEAKEESGFDIELIRKISIFHDSVNEPVKHAFEAKIIGGELGWPEDEILDAKWFTFEEIKNMKNELRNFWIFEAISMVENK